MATVPRTLPGAERSGATGPRCDWNAVGRREAEQRGSLAQGVNAGIDQFGGADDPAPLLAAV